MNSRFWVQIPLCFWHILTWHMMSFMGPFQPPNGVPVTSDCTSQAGQSGRFLLGSPLSDTLSGQIPKFLQGPLKRSKKGTQRWCTVHLHIHIHIDTDIYIYRYRHRYIHIHLHIHIITYPYTYPYVYIFIHIIYILFPSLAVVGLACSARSGGDGNLFLGCGPIHCWFRKLQ